MNEPIYEEPEIIHLKPKKDPFLKFGFVFWVLLLFAGAGFFAYQFFFPKPQSIDMAPISDDIVLIPWIPVDFPADNFYKLWNEHSFQGHTTYTVEQDETGHNILHATSNSTSSVLFRQVSASLTDRPFLTWDWKVTKFPSPKKSQNLAEKSENDFAAKVYAVYGGKPPFNADIVQYVWDEHFPEGRSHQSSSFGKIGVIVVQSGKSTDWVSEKRDLLMDYRNLFGKYPKGNKAQLVAVGVMSDSDNIKANSEVYYRNIEIKKAADTSLLGGFGFTSEKDFDNPIGQVFDHVQSGIQNGISGVQNSVKGGVKIFQNVKNQIQDRIF